MENKHYISRSIIEDIVKIIERDSKSTTYKFALLRGCIEIIQENSPYIQNANSHYHIPLGLLIEKFIHYYYNLINVNADIPQINGSTNQLSFSRKLRDLYNYYQDKGGLVSFAQDLRLSGIPLDIRPLCLELFKKLAETITKMPMKYIGYSINNNYYSIFSYTKVYPKAKNFQINTDFLINNYGFFSIRADYFEALDILGNLLHGMDSLLMRWAEFSVRASKGRTSTEQVLSRLMQYPVSERDVRDCKLLYQKLLEKNGKLYCVWTGDRVKKYDIDHIIPFSIWKNNDLWNLLPAKPEINNKKRNKIPSEYVLNNSQERIMNYWHILQENQSQRFAKEVELSLTGHSEVRLDKAFDRLKFNCEHLIQRRGYEPWTLEK